MSVQHLGSMTWREVKEFVHERVLALLPLGSVEAHGPHLPLNTDVVLAVEVARRSALRMAERGRDVLIYPPVVFTPAVFGMKFPGTVHVGAEVYGAYLRGVLLQVATLGLRTACLATFHADPAHLQVLQRSVCEAQSAPGLGDLRIILPDLTREPWGSRIPPEFRDGGTHAGRYETSCMMAVQQDKVREEVRRELGEVEVDVVRALLEGKVGFEEIGAPQAYLGDPAAATASDGHRYLEAMADVVAEAVAEEARPREEKS
jgi:creatinine amidohydrolase